jgi:hypothetical protein
LNQKKESLNGSKIVNKLYNSVATEKRNYFRTLNENVGSIIKNTKKSVKENFKLTKKQGEIDKLSSEMILYNNPSKRQINLELNINKLSNNTYNSFVKYIIHNQVQMGKLPKNNPIGLKNLSVPIKKVKLTSIN